MLGKKLGEASGKITNVKLLPFKWDVPRVEKTFDGKGTVLGNPFTEIGAYWESFRDDGTRYGEGRILITAANGEMAYFQGYGVSEHNAQVTRYSGHGDFPWTTPTFAHLRRTSAVVEYQIDNDTYSWEMWEWK